MPPLPTSPTRAPAPSAPTLTPRELRALEQTRQRLFQLTNSLSALQADLASNPETLPPWPSLHSRSSIIAQNLASVTSLLASDSHSTSGAGARGRTDEPGAAELLPYLAAAPLPSFPVEHEDTLTQLLRKKVEVGVESSLEKALETGRGVEDRQSWERIWSWAAVTVNGLARERDWEGEFTMEEREVGIENVDTGLRRKLEESDSESDEDDDKMTGVEGAGKPAEVVIPPLRIEDWLRFASTGKRPGG